MAVLRVNLRACVVVFVACHCIGEAHAQAAAAVPFSSITGDDNVTSSSTVSTEPPTPSGEGICDYCEIGPDSQGEKDRGGQLVNAGKTVIYDPPYSISKEMADTTFDLWLNDESTKENQTFAIVSVLLVNVSQAWIPLIPIAEIISPVMYKDGLFDEEGSFTVDYNCLPDNPSDNPLYTVTTVEVTVVFLPEKTTASFQVDKACTSNSTIPTSNPTIVPTTIPTIPQTHGGWSGAGIFFFTVFILTLVFCVGGCTFNNVRRGKQGLAMVPGIEIMKRCKNTICPESRYTPQMNYDTAPAGDDNEYGATYQTNL